MRSRTLLLPGGLLYKELREQLPVALAWLLCVVAGFSLWWSRPSFESQAGPGFLMALQFLAALLLGAFAFSGDKDRFLDQLPISPARILFAKLGASAIALSALTGLTLMLMLGAPSNASISGSDWPNWLGQAPRLAWLSGLGWTAAALLTAVGMGALAAVCLVLVIAFLALVLFGPVWNSWLVATGFAANLWGLHRLLTRNESGALPVAVRFGAAVSASFPRPFQKTGILFVELRRQSARASPFLIAALALSLPPWGDREFLVILIPTIGAILGSGLYAGQERGDSMFFVHLLPFSRAWLVGVKIAVGLAIGLVPVAVFAASAMWEPAPAAPPSIASSTVNAVMLLHFLNAFALAALLAPWVSSSLISASLALMTWAPWTLRQTWPVPESLGLLGLVASLTAALAWWSLARSRALEPRPGKLIIALSLLMPYWLFWFLSSSS